MPHRLALPAFALAFLAHGAAQANVDLPSTHRPRARTCCALASHMPIHLGSAHVPLAMGLVTSARSLGHHSYTGWSRLGEYSGLVYTLRGGFVDTGHVRDNADLTAYLYTRLRPMLRAGAGTIELDPLLGARRVVVTARSDDDETAMRIARRATFEVSIWTEVIQYFGKGKMRGAEETYSSFTPDDLYSNLLGTELGARAARSPLPYDRALDQELQGALARLEAQPSERTRSILSDLAGKWWSADTAWPSPRIALARWYAIGPVVTPRLAIEGTPSPLEVPMDGADGAPLADLYRVELAPDAEDVPHFAPGTVVTGADLPRVVGEVKAAIEAAPKPVEGAGDQSPLLHYLDGLRMVDLAVQGGAGIEARDENAAFGGSLTGVTGDTRGGDFRFAQFDVGHTRERGVIAGFALFRSDALYSCRDPETGKRRAPLVSLLGPCEGAERWGFGGSVAEGFHDGRTGRTALRPLGAYGVFNVLGNGQAPSYGRYRFLLHGGGAIEHVWTEQARSETVPRLAGKATLLGRSSSGRVEARGMTGYRIDPAATEDAAFETSATLRVYLLMGGKDVRGGPVDGIDPWGVASLGVTAGWAYWTRPHHAMPDPSLPFVSAEARRSWQVLLTATVGFEGLVF